MTILNGAIRDFFLQSPHRAVNCLHHVRSSGQGTIVCKSHTSSIYHVQHAVCHVVRRHSSATMFDKVEIAFILALISLTETINQWRRGGNMSTRRKPLTSSFRKCRILKFKNSSSHWDSNLHSSIGGRHLLRKQAYYYYHYYYYYEYGHLI